MIEKYKPNIEKQDSLIGKIACFIRNPRSQLIALLSTGSRISRVETETDLDEPQPLSIVVSERHVSTYSIPKNGSSAVVPDWEWVTVMNKEGVANGNGGWECGGSCGIKEGGKVTVAGYSDEYDRLLVRYCTPGNEVTYGTSCPSNTLFFMSVEEFNSWTPRFRARKQFRRNVDRAVEGLLGME